MLVRSLPFEVQKFKAGYKIHLADMFDSFNVDH